MIKGLIAAIFNIFSEKYCYKPKSGKTERNRADFNSITAVRDMAVTSNGLDERYRKNILVPVQLF